ncbi:MAG: dTMP kinase [Bacteriovoracaceae bacterium]|nr:dTMP kinase [Bacteriovoracaceae bacterium]
MMPPKKGLLISLEGIEGAGKSAQTQTIENYFKNIGMNVVKLREPGGSKFGEGLRNVILNSETDISPLAQAHLFASARAQLLEEIVLPLLKEKENVVLLDRYVDSSFAYQGVALGLGIKTIQEIHAHPPLNLLPDITFYLRITVELSMERQKKRGGGKDFFEKNPKEFYQKLVEGFDLVAKTYPKRVKCIRAENSIEEVSREIEEYLEKWMKNR